jgi:hypothetical protein
MRRFLPLVLAARCLISAGHLLLESASSVNAANNPDDVVTAWDEHMQSLRDTLPPEVMVAGYLEGSDLDSSIPGPDTIEFVLTQYALAPVALQLGPEQDWIVGNFGGDLTPAKVESILDRKPGSYAVHDFGFGLYLIHRLHR